MDGNPDGIRDYRVDYPWSRGGGLKVDRTVAVRVHGQESARTAQVSANWYGRQRGWCVVTHIIFDCVLLVTRTR